MTTAAQPTALQTDRNPFPGLRPFDANENHLFFGRDGQSDEILLSLRQNRFVAVVGTSGSGKSSLIRAGLLPLLHGGFMAKASSNWRIAVFRPGSDPIGNLARALNAKDVFAADTDDLETATLITETTLRRSGLGLIEAARQARMPAKANLLIVVDQFEELFRFKSSEATESGEDDAAFVKLLIEAAQQSELPIYCVITMRSDFIGDCARFRQLPETINRGLYLIPIMTREQRREAITAPAAVAETEIAPRLINRVLNDAGENPEQLPLLQHALMRTWAHWKSSQGVDPIDLDSYEEIGGLGEALSRHADEAYNELSEDRQHIAERVFRALTEKGAGNREVRRPKKVAELCAITGAGQKDVIAIIENFRRPGRSFLMPPSDVPLSSETLIDISHESLIRGWKRLFDWVDNEALSAGIYRRVADTAVLYEQGEAALWRDPDLQVALGWRDKAQPTKAWGEHYHFGYDAAIDFLEKSKDARDARLAERERQRRQALLRTRIFAAVLAVLLVMASALGVWAMKERQNALNAKVEADHARIEAVKAREEADDKRQEAEKNKRMAEQERGKAEAAKREADENARSAMAAAAEARRQKDNAEAATKEAVLQKDKAEAAAAIADRAVVGAEKANLEDMSRINWLTNELIALSSPQNSVRWRYVRSSALTNRGSHAEAEAELTKLLEVAPDFADARMSRGYMYMLTDRVPQSIQDFESVIAAYPTSSLGYLNRGLSQGILGAYGDASTSIQNAINTFKSGKYEALAENQVAPVILRATGHRTFSATGEEFQTALHYELANIEALRGGEDFLKFLQKADQQHGSEGAYLTAINWAWLQMEKRPKGTQDYGGWVSQGALWERLGPLYCGEAAYAYAQFQQKYQENPDPRYGGLARFANQRAAALPCKIPKDPLREDVQALALKADDAIDKKKYEEAEVILTKAIALEPRNVNLLLKRAEVFYNRDKSSQSRADAELVLELAGGHPKALFYRAMASADTDDVVKNLRQVLDSDPTNSDALDWLSKTLEEKDPDEAIKLLVQAIRLQPYNEDLHFRKAKLQEKMGRYVEAQQSIASAIRINSYVIEYYDERASIEHKLAKPPTQIWRNLCEGYDEVADLLLKRGDVGAALDTYAKSLKILAGISQGAGSADVQRDLALTTHKVARLIGQQSESTDKTIEHLKFMFGDVKGLEGVLNDEIKNLASSP